MRIRSETSPPVTVREQTWSKLTDRNVHGLTEWDLLVIGGGITGAGILREAARRDLNACLIEQRDFAWGTSSRSSNMVHGGLRYLMAGRLKLTHDSLRERERLLREAPGLVDPLGFLFSGYKGRRPGRWSFRALLTVYDLLARRRNHRYYPPYEYVMLAPRITLHGLRGGAQCFDAVTDDARLVLRIIQEAQQEGALALNYVAADELMMEKNRVCGAVVRDVLTGSITEVRAKAVVNATGAWADRFRKRVGGGRNIRPLRGSHLVLPFWRLPVAQAMGMKHPVDRRSVFLLPWKGVTVVGSTDLDHNKGLDIEPSITPEEVDYLMAIVHYQFPALGIDRTDIVSTYAGIRPVIGTGALNPSSEKREHSIWVEGGLISVSGGKLTTFRLIALDVLKRAAQFIPSLRVEDTDEPVFSKVSSLGSSFQEIDNVLKGRLIGRYGIAAEKVTKSARGGELMLIPGTDTLWVELRWGARSEAVVHLEDLLLRRTRLGVILAHGGEAFFDRIKVVCQEELGWDENRWQDEENAYRKLWKRCYSVPG